MAFSQLLKSHEARGLPNPISTGELTALVRMALHPIVFNVSDQQTVGQREANERAFNCAADLLKLSEGPLVRGTQVSDVAALEMLRSSWFTNQDAIT